MKKIYIVRKFIFVEGGSKHFYEENVFDQIDLALKFVKLISDEEDSVFLSEVVTLNLNSIDVDKENDVKIFDFRGKSLCESSQNNSITGIDLIENFSIGDIVEILPFPWNRYSPTCVKTIGVVSTIPCVSNLEQSPSEDEYIIDYIRDGFLGHWHVNRKSIKKYNDNIPENLIFLKILSDHYKGIICISDKLLHKIYKGDIFVEKVKYYNFNDQDIVHK